MKTKILVLLSLFVFFSCKSIPKYTISNDLSQFKGIPVPLNDLTFYIKINKPLNVYRVWNKDKPWTLMGRWWTLDNPTGEKDEYRKANAICPEWNPLTSIASAKLRKGSMFFIGTTKGVNCQTVEYQDTSTLQIFIPTPYRFLRKVKTREWN